VCSRWIPHVITDANKQKRVELAKQMLRVLDGGFQNIITGDETWFNYYTVSTKEDNKVWLKSGELRPQIARTSKNSKKRMFCVFFTVEGVVARIVVPKGQYVTSLYYVNTVLPEVFANFMEMSGRHTVRDVILHHDNASPHKAEVVTSYLKRERVQLLPHPPYSPDLAPCDFFLFPRIKKELGGRKFENVENLARAVQAVSDSIPKDEYYKVFQSWQKRLKRCIEVGGEYFEGM
jgi:histone-lysine N-methyltransferase SETMAR